MFRSATKSIDAETRAGPKPPELTARERDVLTELCRLLASGDVFTEPASIREIAQTLVVTEAAVKHHLTRLHDKFGALLQLEPHKSELLQGDDVRYCVVAFDPL